MEKISVRKLSILGLVLMAASAVTAAVLPKSSNDAKFEGSVNNGTLRAQSGVGLSNPGDPGQVVSCINDPAGPDNCHFTVATATGAQTQVNINGDLFTTNDNTSTTDANAVDTTSVLVLVP